MKKLLLLVSVTISTLNCYSQISFEKGYYINNSNQKIDCLIKNLDWKNNPTEFEYKLTEEDASKNATIKSVKEFGIYNISKYSRNTVNIDKSSENVNNLSTSKEPIFKEETLFLKFLIEGKSNLYQYVDRNAKRFFYTKENSTIEQLIYKRYKDSEHYIGKNNKFRQQLWVNLKCENFKLSDIENIDYTKNDLVRLFTKHNECHNVELVNFEPKQKRDLFNLTIRPRINRSSLTIHNSIYYPKGTGAEFSNQKGFGFGLEAEFILPFNKNKWAIAVEPTYQNFKSENSDKAPSGVKFKFKVDYRSIEVPISLRHYFFLSENSKVFLNASYVFDLNSKSSIEFESNTSPNLSSLEIKTSNNLAMGIGYKQNDRYSLEIRYQTNRGILESYKFWDSQYNSLSVIFGYSLF